MGEAARVIEWGEAGGVGGGAPRHVVRHVDLWELLVWVYRDQKAHRYLRRPFDWFVFAMAEIGEQAGDDTPRPTVHGDAALVHGAVLELGETRAQTVVWHAAMVERPEPSVAQPMPGPAVPDRRRDIYRWAEIRGRRVDYKVVEVERVAVAEPIVERRGRGRMVVVGQRLVPVAVEYCPIAWTPDPSWVAMMNGTHELWRGAMVELLGEVLALPLRDHRVLGFAEEA